MGGRLPRSPDVRPRRSARSGCLAISILAAAVAVVACGRPAPTTVVPTEPAPATAVVPIEPTPFPWILIGEGVDSAVVDAVSGWAADMGMDAQVGSPGAVDPDGLMAAVGAEAELASVADAWSDEGVLLVLLEPAMMRPGPIVSTIGPETRLDQAGFLAGLAAGYATKFGGVGLVGGDDGSAFASGFGEGLRYACPRCRLESVSDPAAVPFGVDVLVVPPATDVPTGQAGPGEVWLVLTGSAAPEASQPVAARVALVPETLVLAALEALTNGEAGHAWEYGAENGGLQITELDPEAISPGRERLMREAELGLRLGQLVVGGGE